MASLVDTERAIEDVRRASLSSLRDFFAAHAPAEVPEWFRHESPAKPGKPPAPADYFGDKIAQDAARSWFRDPCYDFAEGLDDGTPGARFVADCEAWWKARREWELDDAQARYFQWRYRYAEGMLSTRGG